MNTDNTINALIDQLTSDIGLTLKNARNCDDGAARDEQIAKAQTITQILTAIEEIDYAVDHLIFDIQARKKLVQVSASPD